MVLVKRTLTELKSASRRIRKTDEEQVARICHSIETYGVIRPILITSSNEIIDGHAVFEAASKLGIVSLPCIVVDQLSPTDIMRVRISLNRLAETGRWDSVELRLELEELSFELGNDFTVPGLDGDLIDHILLDDAQTQENLETEQKIPPIGTIAAARLGEIWQLGPHRLGCGSARDFAFLQKVVPSNATMTLCLTDPPYGVPITGHVTSGNHRDFVEGGAGTSKEELYDLLKDAFLGIHRLLEEGGLCMSFMDWRGIGTMLSAAKDAQFDLLNMIVWAKTNGGMGSLWRSQHELLPVFKKGSAPHINNVNLGKKGRYRSNLWTYPGASSLGSDARSGLSVHPTVKPVAMLVDAILDVTRRGDMILDPFSGSGSCLVAAHKTGRIFCGVELDPLYVDVILRRWVEQTGIEPIKVSA
ncbi:MAG: DNA modification methylase [Aestuariivirga sp.]